MAIATNLGFPRIGAKRELKKATEAFWKNQISEAELIAAGKAIRKENWLLQKDAGIDHIPVGDFSFYDHVLDMSALLGCVPERYEWDGTAITADTYFAMARGSKNAPAMEMTKWFNTNYHYIVPEFESVDKLKISSSKIFDEIQEAQSLGITPRPVILGPLSYIGLGKIKAAALTKKDILTALKPLYAEILARFKTMGVEWVQIDEPLLVTDICDETRQAYRETYGWLRTQSDIKVLLATYFEDLGPNIDLALDLDVDGLHIDTKRGPKQVEYIIEHLPKGRTLSLGLVDGRNIWRSDLQDAIDLAKKALASTGSSRLMVAPSCSMIHSPVDLEQEDKLDSEIKNWLAFAKQKINEIALITSALNEGEDSIATELADNQKAIAERKVSPRIHNPDVKQRTQKVNSEMAQRKSSFATREQIQKDLYKLPTFPTTTIGSFPQTSDIRAARAAYKKGDLSRERYVEAMKKEIEGVVRYQEAADIDVLVHGEAERNDMVEYFGEHLEGFAFTRFGWVQSYGSRYVKPPIIFGDVSRPKAMTVEWSRYAQSLTARPMKGMLTGPVTIMFWSFIRDDQPLSDTCRQIALAIRDEVCDLETAGVTIIQIDEPAIREGLPIHKDDWAAYLKWAVECFKLSSCGVEDSTQIHTHMCYSEFNDIIESIAALDADVISIETSRSQMELLDAFADYAYPNQIGPGVYDIHSPRIPSEEDMTTLLQKASDVLKAEQIWVNPDCGLKTRGWEEVKPALDNMVKSAKHMRLAYKKSQAA
ncbi:MAG: 5-methyltetrahydropteroyltriglutamate--homocysteine S-methyltransferase [Pseudomonadota bacterium]|nr:5-methyltetrahydropteroyltriglutamate--homocysteine S-methyltransferase [Pseudomonadota bacterium]